ncbi:MAG: hypothetical protein C4527_19665 [Candidatus Omnitrophota bacterium]|jgi:hypothetical protein|nr:MAG: hypothetical protein C4527_19665 [Candidatus Omnitrophota bacterium]
MIEKIYENSFLVSDSTSASEVYLVVKEDKGQLFDNQALYDESEAFISSNINNISDLDVPKKVTYGLDLATRFNKQLNLRHHVFSSIITNYAIQLGTILLKLKELVKGRLKQNWEVWASQNIAFLKESRRQIYMRVAEFKSVRQYAFLSLGRLDRLIAAAKNIQSDDPIGEFFRTNGIKISFDESHYPIVPNDLLFTEMNLQIDTAIVLEKIKKMGIKSIEKENVKSLIRIKKKVDIQGLISNWKKNQDENLCLDDYLETTIANLGKPPQSAGKKSERIISLNRQIAVLKDTINHCINTNASITTLDKDSIMELKDALSSLIVLYENQKGEPF